MRKSSREPRTASVGSRGTAVEEDHLVLTATTIPVWLRFLIVGLVASTASALLGKPALRVGFLVIISIASMIAVGVGVVRTKPRLAKVWWGFLVSIAILASSTVVAGVYDHRGSTLGLTTYEVVRSAGYLIFFVCALAAARTRRAIGDLDSFLDSLILGTAFGLFAWRVFLSEPMTSTVASRAQVITAYATPALDVILVVALLRRILSADRSSGSLRLILWAVVAATATHLASALAIVNASELIVHAPVQATVFIFLGAAALHPSMGEVTQRDEVGHRHFGVARIAMLALALLNTPLLLMLYGFQQGVEVDSPVLAGSSAISIIVIVRLISLAQSADRANARERARERRFESLVQNSSDLLAVIDKDRRLTYVSPAITSILGYSQHEAVGGAVMPLFHPDDVIGLTQLMDALRPGETSRLTLVRVHHRNSSWRWVEARGVNLVDDPSVNGLVVNGRDVTERVAAERQLVTTGIQQSSVAQLGRAALTATDVKSIALSAASLSRSTLDADECVFLLLTDHTVTSAIRVTWDSVEDIDPAAYSHTPLFAACRSSDDPQQFIDRNPDNPLSDLELPEPIPLVATRALEGELYEMVDEMVAMDREASDSSILAVRVFDQDRDAGLIAVRSGGPRRFSVNEASFLDTMARTLGLAVGRREAEARSRHRALHDDLTKLPNRTLFVDRLTAALARMQRQQCFVAVLFLDIDHFKVINDSLGHSAGDRVLTAIAERLQDLLRPGDTVARFGGDEFTLLLDNLTDVDEAVQVAERIRRELRSAVVFAGTQLHPTVSVGISIATGFASNAESLLRDADAAMYRAKELGRDRVELFDDSMRDRAISRLRTEIDLRRALRQNELIMHYQPIIDMRDGAVTGFEALIRWEHPRDGLIPPAQFIPVAEQTGLISDISKWIFQETMSQSAAWSRLLGDAAPTVAINVSARSLASEDLPDQIASAIQNSSATPGKICLEITESALMNDVGQSITTLQRLRDLGVKIAIDDFGTGYSSLTYLKQFPVDILKIDASFISGLARSSDDSAIVAAVVRLAETLNLRAIAEGVETPEQLFELKRLGCPSAQGFLLGMPELANDVDLPARFDFASLPAPTAIDNWPA